MKRESSLDVRSCRGTRRRFRLVGMTLLGVWLLAAGCAGAGRADPMAAFKEICDRSLASDLEYVRGKITASLLAEAGGREDDFVREVMQEMQGCRGQSWERTDDPNRVVIHVARSKGGSVLQSRLEMVHDGQRGYRLASRLRDEKPLKAVDD